MSQYRGKRQADAGRAEGGPMQDPFDEDGGGGLRDRLGRAGRAVAAFFGTRRGKIALGAAAGAVALCAAGGIALSLWVRPPDLPAETEDPAETVDMTGSGDGESAGEEDLYPDDGYNGDMPAVSGDRKEGMFTFLLIGTDQGGGNTDTIMVVSYDTAAQDVNIMSIPRDTMVNVSWDIKKINSVYARYKDGVGALQKQVAGLIGFTPDFYVKVDLSMFVELVDLIGGVEFDVPQDMDYDDPYQDLHIHLKEGTQLLDGQDAMGLVRFRRYSEGDIRRVEVQQSFMKALIKQCLALENWGKIKAYIDLAMENVETDLSSGSVVWFAANALGLRSAPALQTDTDVRTFTLPADYYASAWSRSTHSQQSYVTIYPRQVVELVNEYFNPYEQEITTAMLDAMSILSDGTIASSTGVVRDTAHNAAIAAMSAKDETPEDPQDGDGGDETEAESGEPSDEPVLPEEGGAIADGDDSGGGTDLPAETGGGEEPNAETGGGEEPDAEDGTGTEPDVPEEPETPEETAPDWL